ncbi:YktB family protein [Lederbergia galactosidilytica]|uniref:UPF0637 protein ABB05_14815 n=1 Tax=Lederbergia galactosidilytica TaxID=217031 RepID=A0A0Q9Y4Q8_9BACI|nr:DUF1054 domain-containing protein [Lederbergia galactosidilytica]KRG11972.1 hypothetical protein ACA29_12815 [Lederbergia galactosidilytica]KRG15465.1 hypothetical protein ACA30_06365 [Virgibacillus soli]MBP1916251.1 uncharacterized protein YktB (UPF0637 family) [Lederbergia galactosidilytica]OAK68365.1 hypothetical protein ABB05_14815 [Lederbergia galactosidilytica]
MVFKGFEQQDFDTFLIHGLDERMEAIQERIQPKFREIGDTLAADLSAMIGSEMFLHIAKHARRTVNPPQDTWLAIAANKRGYKKHPHFQVGLFDDHVFIWLAFIYELPNKDKMAQNFLDHLKMVHETIPADYMISQDHMKKDAAPLHDLDLEKILTRFRDVKKAEFLIGKHIAPTDPLLKDGDRFLAFTKETFESLVPLYHLAYK